MIFPLPAVADPREHPAALCAIIAAVAEGDLTPLEAEALARLLGQHLQAVETADLATRIAKLEENL